MSNINWADVVSSIDNINGEVRTIGEDFYQNNNGEFNEIIKLWGDAGYTKNKVEWINYYPGTHFDKKVEEQFGNEVSLKPVRSWISCVRPGKSAPWHQDIDDAMKEYESLGELERYTMFITAPSHGQVLMIEQNCYYMQPINTLVKWPSHLAWHGASNCGFGNHYLYHFLGYK